MVSISRCRHLNELLLDLLFSLDDGQSFSHQLLVDPAEVGYFLLAFMMDVHAAFCTGSSALAARERKDPVSSGA